MSGMYDEPKVSAVKLTPYPHEELGRKDGPAKDPVKFLQAAEQRARERQIAYETVRLLRQDVITCYRKEGVNHYENCKEVCETYYNTIIKKDVGQVHPNWENKEKHDGW
uniref:NADH dehydrogenase [ubiquinone] 1 beta subcomplex subunit 10 n=1 Tax=Odontella aurita TaxID=265563 RepID=A0A7S4NIE6_9STRA|mmetsp:Transcript_9642/g.28886  ORF Transcript_9642/g.28886 Transcript_9642/m.28886 type:complete len:109 (+) Transcript_9642:61-387(+)|eukprot:CAMPEP_0113575582 /NCGR_PEP_ID=MMETSP0015_2-20120614/27781_1 /TAXON_ID=2838 /ORGANISM="Odontella" /LENGTH=108 /DNA_ID=CAMNT_0000478843 /DNA_START=64 /DNA_END=390 /DNA_ORIENTATION=- /assembly_acc=CAM_ASM_000160